MDTTLTIKIGNWLYGCIQRVAVNGSVSKSRSVMSGAVDTTEGRGDIQGDLDEMWAHMKFIKFKKTKCKVLHVGQGNPGQE